MEEPRLRPAPALRHSALRATFAVRLRGVRGRQSQRAPSFLLPCWRPSLYSLWDTLGEPDICHGWAAPPEILLQWSERQLGQLGEVTALSESGVQSGPGPSSPAWAQRARPAPFSLLLRSPSQLEGQGRASLPPSTPA